MMRRPFWIAVLAMGVLAASGGAIEAGSPLTGEKMIVVLRPELPSDRDFITYVAATMDAGYLPRYLVESTFLWARDKPRHMSSYFREALTVRAAKQGIDLPKGQPPLSGTVRGQVVYEVNLGFLTITTPVADAVVRLNGHTITSDNDGKFVFEDVPFGRQTITAEGRAGLVFRSGSAGVTLPTPPPSTQAAHVTVYLR